MKLVDAFWTFQGEGLHAGRRAFFVRLPHCNLKCEWCDTSFDKYTDWSDEAFASLALSEPSRFAVITGGEPLLNKQMPALVLKLRDLGFEVAAESNGTVPPKIKVDFLTVSPKRQAKDWLEPYYVHPDTWAAANEFKYVVDESFDFKILNRHDVTDGKRYSLSPEYGDMKAGLEKITSYIKERPEWRISLQTHKWMGIP